MDIKEIEDEFNEILERKKNSNTSEKNIFFENIEYVKKSLNKGISFAKQVKEYNKDCGSKISESSYKNYVKEYLPMELKRSICRATFNINIKHIKDYFLKNSKDIKCSELYLFLIEHGHLLTVKKDKSSFLSYELFCEYLKDILEDKNSIYLVKFDKIKIREKVNKPEIQKKESFKSVTNDLIASKHVKQKIGIELLDGRIDNCPLVYLKNEVIMKNTSNSAYDFNEKNYIVVPSIYKNNLIDFEIIKKSILQKEIMKNYSLIFHDNGKKDGNIYIYRLIDKELHVLKKFSSGHCMDFEIYYNNGIKRFLSLFEEKFF